MLVNEIRTAMDRLLATKIDDPTTDLSASEIVAAVEHLLITEGI